jgi:glycosyltransferase involved in cell wall biosynthesis/SAM-dependent methyltransferase
MPMDTFVQTAPDGIAASAPMAHPPIPADHINELYRGEIFTEETARIARDRIHWMCSQCVGEKVLDVGCSQGITAILLAREGMTVTAIDSHPATVAFARNEIARETKAVQARLSLLETDLDSLAEDAAFDTIVLGEVLEHQALPERFLRAAARRVVPGGRLVVTTPFALHPHPDHKISVMPRHIAEMAQRLGLRIRSLDVWDNYIRCVLERPQSGEAANETLSPQVLLTLTEDATLRSQQRLYDRLSDKADLLKKRADALKTTQKKLADATAAVALQEQQLREQHAREIETLRMALADAQAQSERAEMALAALRAEHNHQTSSLEASRERKVAEPEESSALHDEDVLRIRTEHETALAELRKVQAEELETARRQLADVQARYKAAQQAMVSLQGEQEQQIRSLRQSIASADARHAREADSLRQALASAEAKSQQERSATEATTKRLLQQKEDSATRLAAQAAAMARELSAARSDMAAARAAQETLRKQVTQLKQDRESLQAQISTLLLKHKHETEVFKGKLAVLKTTLANTRAASSYRIGRALVRSMKSIRGALALPSELWSIGRDVMARRRARRLDRGDDVAHLALPSTASKRRARSAQRQNPADDISVDALVALYRREGMPAAMARLMSALPAVGERMLSVRMLQFGKALGASGEQAAEVALAENALSLDRSDATLRGYFWVAQRAGQFEQACRTIGELEALYGPRPNKDQTATLAKLRSSPAYQLSLLSLVVEQPLDRIESVPRRVCYVLHNSLPYSSGGYGTRSHGVASGLKNAGYDVVVVTRPGFPLDIKPDLSASDVPGEHVVDAIRYVHTLAPQRKGMSLMQYVMEAADAVEARLREFRPSLVMAASNYVTALPSLIAARRLGLPFIYEVRGLWEITRISRDQDFENTPAFAIQRLLESRVAQHADHVFTLTEPMREELVQRGVDAGKVHLLPNSCDPTRFLPRSRDGQLAQRLGIPGDVPVIGYIGTFVDYEGLPDLALACALLKRRGVAFRLLLVGNENASGQDRGPITEEIASIARAEGFSEWLIMPGRVPHEEVEKYYSLIDIAPFPRRPLPVCEMVSPMKPLEALAMEKAVLVSSVRALTEMVAEGRTGRVFEKGNIAALADVLHDMIEQPAQRQTLGREGRRWVSEERTWDQVGRKFRSIVNPNAAEAPTQLVPPSKAAVKKPATPTPAVPSRSPGESKPVAADSQRKPESKLQAMSSGIKLEDLVVRFKAEGLEATAAHLMRHAETLDAPALASRLLQLGKALAEAGEPEAELSLTRKAVEVNRSDATLRAYFWAAQRHLRFDEACEAIRGLEALYGAKPTTEQQATLAKLYGSAAYQTTLPSLIPQQPVDRVDSLPHRVCYFLHNSLPYSSGGYATRSHGISTGLKNAGYEVIVVTRPGFPVDIKANLRDSEVPPEQQIDGIRYRRLLEPRRKGMPLTQYISDAATVIERCLRELRPSLVVAASNHVTALPALIAARRLGLPFIYEVRGLWEVTRISREPEFEQTASFAAIRLLESCVVDHADQVFTLTEPMREELVQRGVDFHKVHLLPNSCDPTRFLPRKRDELLAQRLGIPADTPVIGYIGTFVDYEGLEDLTRACAVLKRRGIVFRLLLVGNENTSGQERGPITEEISSIARSERFSDWLIMPGRVPHDEVESYYSLIDIAPFPRKPLPVCEMVSPMKPLEALAMEKAVVVSSVRALTEMIADGRTGRVFEKGNVVSLADQLEKLIADPQARLALGKNGRQWVEANRTWDQIGQRFVLSLMHAKLGATTFPAC